MEIVTVHKSGTSFKIVLPAPIARLLDIEPGDKLLLAQYTPTTVLLPGDVIVRKK